MLVHCFHSGDVVREFFSYQSGPPRDEKEFLSATEFILGHFTSSFFLSSILEHGLLPDVEKTRATDDGVPSDSKSVYLATTFDRYYLRRAVERHRGEGLVVEVQVFRSALLADESQSASANLEQASPDEALYLSMCGGACKHRGLIPSSQILSITDCRGLMRYEKIANLKGKKIRGQASLYSGLP